MYNGYVNKGMQMKNEKKVRNETCKDNISKDNSDSVDSEEVEDYNFDNLASTTATTLGSIDIIRNQLSKIPLDPSEKNYIEFHIMPLLNIIDELSATSFNLSSSANQLYNSSVERAKRSKIKDTQKLAYDINKECEDLYYILKKRLKILKCK